MATRTTRSDGSRTYAIEGKEYPSVTTILGALGKPWLAPWAAKMEREAALAAAADIYTAAINDEDEWTATEFRRSVEQRLGDIKEYRKVSDAAKEIGSQAHALIEWYEKREPGETRPQASPEAENAFQSYRMWAEDVVLDAQRIEVTVYSPTYGFAGTADSIGVLTRIDRRDGLVDYKTARAIYPEHLLQVSAYVKAAQEMALLPREAYGVIARLPKIIGDPAFEVRYIEPEEIDRLFETFLHVKAVYEFLEEK